MSKYTSCSQRKIRSQNPEARTVEGSTTYKQSTTIEIVLSFEVNWATCLKVYLKLMMCLS